MKDNMIHKFMQGSLKPCRPRVSAEPSRKTFFSFFWWRAQNQNCKESFSARQAAVIGDGRRISVDFASWICELNLAK
jgi:hypothetical protein